MWMMAETRRVSSCSFWNLCSMFGFLADIIDGCWNSRWAPTSLRFQGPPSISTPPLHFVLHILHPQRSRSCDHSLPEDTPHIHVAFSGEHSGVAYAFLFHALDSHARHHSLTAKTHLNSCDYSIFPLHTSHETRASGVHKQHLQLAWRPMRSMACSC